MMLSDIMIELAASMDISQEDMELILTTMDAAELELEDMLPVV